MGFSPSTTFFKSWIHGNLLAGSTVNMLIARSCFTRNQQTLDLGARDRVVLLSVIRDTDALLSRMSMELRIKFLDGECVIFSLTLAQQRGMLIRGVATHKLSVGISLFVSAL